MKSFCGFLSDILSFISSQKSKIINSILNYLFLLLAGSVFLVSFFSLASHLRSSYSIHATIKPRNIRNNPNTPMNTVLSASKCYCSCPSSYSCTKIPVYSCCEDNQANNQLNCRMHIFTSICYQFISLFK